MNVDHPISDSADKAGKPVQTMGIHSVATRIGEQPRTKGGALGTEADLRECAGKSIENLLVGNSEHERTLVALGQVVSDGKTPHLHAGVLLLLDYTDELLWTEEPF